MKTRNLLVRKRKCSDEVEKTLQKAYKKRVEELLSLGISFQSVFGVFDEVFHNLTTISKADSYLHSLYEAFLAITSYYQHSQAGRGALATALLKKIGKPEMLEAELSMRKLLEKLGQSNAQIIEDENTNVKFDLVVKQNKRLVLCELKMKVYSGCTAGRVEMMHKFQKVVRILTDSRYQGLQDALKNAGIDELRMIGGILFNIRGEPATLEDDIEWVTCYSGLEKGIREIKGYLDSRNIEYEYLIDDSSVDSAFHLQFKTASELDVHIIATYGQRTIDEMLCGTSTHDIGQFHELLGHYQYEDLWVAQAIAINERANLQLRNFQNTKSKNIITFILINEEARHTVMKFANSESTLENALSQIDDLIAKEAPHLKESDLRFASLLLASLGESYDFDDYLADIIQLLAWGRILTTLKKRLDESSAEPKATT